MDLFSQLLEFTKFIVVVGLVSWGFTVLVVWHQGKRLLGWAKRRLLLGRGSSDDPDDNDEDKGRPRRPDVMEAQDVVVEDFGDERDDKRGRTKESDRAASDDDWPYEEDDPVRVRRETGGHASVRKTRQRAAYERLDADSGATAQDCVRVTKSYASDPVLGPRVEALVSTLESADLRRQTLLAEIDAAFAPRTMSWDKFSAPVHDALDAILRNSCLLSNRIQAFDTAGYRRVFRSVQSDGGVQDASQGSKASERLRLYQEALTSMDAVQQTNDDLLLELDKLAAELDEITGSGHESHGDAILREIERLVREAAYYR
jgi:hypothetical protein